MYLLYAFQCYVYIEMHKKYMYSQNEASEMTIYVVGGNWSVCVYANALVHLCVCMLGCVCVCVCVRVHVCVHTCACVTVTYRKSRLLGAYRY